jgi:hypothetical protein
MAGAYISGMIRPIAILLTLTSLNCAQAQIAPEPQTTEQ